MCVYYVSCHEIVFNRIKTVVLAVCPFHQKCIQQKKDLGLLNSCTFHSDRVSFLCRMKWKSFQGWRCVMRPSVYEKEVVTLFPFAIPHTFLVVFPFFWAFWWFSLLFWTVSITSALCLLFSVEIVLFPSHSPAHLFSLSLSLSSSLYLFVILSLPLFASITFPPIARLPGAVANPRPHALPDFMANPESIADPGCVLYIGLITISGVTPKSIACSRFSPTTESGFSCNTCLSGPQECFKSISLTFHIRYHTA